nr:hypothetical protein [Tanacetum cinerariifolium]
MGKQTTFDIGPLHLTTVDLSGTDVRAILFSEDKAQESEEDILGATDEMDDIPQSDETQHQSSPPYGDKLTSPTAPHAEASNVDSSSDDILKKCDDTFPLTERQLVKYLRKVSCVLFERITEDQWEKHEEAAVHYANLKASINDYYNENKDQRKLVKALSIVCLDPDEPVRVKFMINGKTYYLADKEIQEKTKVIKVVREESKKIGIYPKEAIPSKAGELFKKTQDAEYVTISNRLKLEPITDIKSYPKTKSVVITVYRGTDVRNFNVHKPFLFGAFGISELDELREIIPKKKNTMVKDLMNSLSQRYERLRQIPEPEYGIFFRDEFGDQAFQRWSNIDKVGMEALMSYLVAASMVKSPENARFSMKLRKLIVEHPDQEKLKSKKVTLEALGYKMD